MYGVWMPFPTLPSKSLSTNTRINVCHITGLGQNVMTVWDWREFISLTKKNGPHWKILIPCGTLHHHYTSRISPPTLHSSAYFGYNSTPYFPNILLTDTFKAFNPLFHCSTACPTTVEFCSLLLMATHEQDSQTKITVPGHKKHLPLAQIVSKTVEFKQW